MEVLQNDSSFQFISSWLEKSLPESIVVYNVIQLIKDRKLQFFKIWLDSQEDPNIIAIRAEKEKCDTEYYGNQLYVYSPCQKDSDKMEAFLRSPGVVDVKGKTVLYSVQEHIAKTAPPVLMSMGLVRQRNLAETYTYGIRQSDMVLHCELPVGYTSRPLTLELAEYVNSKWKFSKENASTAIKDVIKWGNPSLCIFDECGNPVAWAIQKFYRFVGNLHTEDGHRGKGIGQYVLANITKLILEKDDQAFTAIEKDNLASIKLHEKVGYRRCPDSMSYLWIECCSDNQCGK